MQPPVASALDLLSEPRQAIIRQINEEGPMRAERLARRLNVTVGAVRQHLAGLAADGLVTHDVVRGQPGRPKHVYRLTDRGMSLFPRIYGPFATEMITFFGEEADALLERFFQVRTERNLERMGISDDEGSTTLGERVGIVASTLRDDGFMAEVTEPGDGTLLMTESNCALMDLAKADGRICSNELELLRRALPDACVERLAYMLEGGPVCTYRITPRSAAQEPLVPLLVVGRQERVFGPESSSHHP